MNKMATIKPEASPQPATEKPPVKQRRKPEPIVVDLDEFLQNPGHYAKMSTATRFVKIKDSAGEIVCIYGGCLW